MRVRASIGIAGLMALGLAGPTQAAHGGIHPAFRTERVYFDCIARPTTQGGWSREAPGPVSSGEGCATGPQGGATSCWAARFCGGVRFEGAFTGNLRDLTLEAHLTPPTEALSTARRLRVWLSVDGASVVSAATVSLVSTGDLVETYRFSITSLGCAVDVVDDDGNVTVRTDGLALEDGAGSQVRTVRVFLEFLAWGPVIGSWVWGASEFPGGITFNPTSLSAPWVSPGDPADCSDGAR